MSKRLSLASMQRVNALDTVHNELLLSLYYYFAPAKSRYAKLPDLICMDDTYLPHIGQRTGPGFRGVGGAGSHGKATMMTMQIDMPAYPPTEEELQTILARAHAMRARAISQAVAKSLAAVTRIFIRPEQRRTAEI